jgi:hypothetical protein
MYSYTGFGDYPMIIPDKKISGPEDLFPGWMLLSYQKEVSASSVLRSNTAEKAVNEDIKTWWSAATGDENEFFTVNLEQACDVYALQINFADADANWAGRNPDFKYQYIIQHSPDGENWETLVDRSINTEDVPHDYIQLAQPVRTQYLRITNVKVSSGKISLSGFRVFGKGLSEKPEEVSFSAVRNKTDMRKTTINWGETAGAVGINIRYGAEKDKLYLNYMVFNRRDWTIGSLNTNENYFFSVDVFNEAGITRGTEIKSFDQTGIETVVREDAVFVYPNPVQDILKIKFTSSNAEPVSICLYDTKGVLLKQVQSTKKPGVDQWEIDLSNYREVMFLIQLKTNDQTYTKKIVHTLNR